MTQNALVSFSLIFYALIGLGFVIAGFVTPRQDAKFRRILWLILGILVLITVLITWSYIHGLEMKFQ
ncbi:MAG: hypothetical protein V1784_07390 [bacterium]